MPVYYDIVYNTSSFLLCLPPRGIEPRVWEGRGTTDAAFTYPLIVRIIVTEWQKEPERVPVSVLSVSGP